MPATNRILRVSIDEAMTISRSPEAEHERAVAIADLVEDNRFQLKSGGEGPYSMLVSAGEQRLFFDIYLPMGGDPSRLTVALGPLRGVIKDYFLMCDSYYEAITHASPARIEAIDMGRRGIHNEGSLLLLEQVSGFAETDLETARRLFTLICVLRLK